MKSNQQRRRVFGLRSRPAALCLLAGAAALLLTAALYRSAVSSQLPPDAAADALPQLNLIGRHTAEAAEYARQIKARYAPTDAQYVEARRRYEATAESFNALIDALSESLRSNTGARGDAAVAAKVRVAVEKGDSFSEWAEGELRLMRRARGGGGRPAKVDDVAEAASALARSLGPRDDRVKGRAIQLMGQLVKFKPWDEIPPVVASAGTVASPTPSPSPLPSPSNP